MRCNEFESRFDAYVGGTLAAADRSAAETHLHECSHCAALLAALQGAGEGVPVAFRNAFVQDVLQQTTGRACARAQSLLCAFVDGELPARDSELVAAHCQDCADCAALGRTLTRVSRHAAELADRNPDLGFTADVLRATAGLRRRRPIGLRLAAWGVQLIQRPRFAWEVAYVGTLAIVLLCSTPVSPFRRVSQKALAAIQLDPQPPTRTLTRAGSTLWVEVEDDVSRAWSWTGGRVQARAHAWQAQYVQDHQETVEACKALHRDTRQLRSAVGAANLASASYVLRDIGTDLEKLWRSVRPAETGDTESH